MIDPTYRLLVGDVRARLADLDDESVDCVVTSPPYWNLRDYGTGEWEGGDPACDHVKGEIRTGKGLAEWSREHARGGGVKAGEVDVIRYRDVCATCGATRLDDQIGLEDDPLDYIDALVDVFAEIHRVLAPHGTVWLNLGDTYASKPRGTDGGWEASRLNNPGRVQKRQGASLRKNGQRHRGKQAGLKEKDLCMIPARVAIALQEWGWWVRSDCIWSKPNPMPSSVTDRPSTSHEYVYLLTKRPRYWFDMDAVREPLAEATVADGRFDGTGRETPYGSNNGKAEGLGSGSRIHPSGLRNLRTVWTIATRPFAGAHFAVFPPDLAQRCVLAGAAREVCRTCGKPRERIVESEAGFTDGLCNGCGRPEGQHVQSPKSAMVARGEAVPCRATLEVGWTDCGHDDHRRGMVLDPFAGAGTTLVAAMREGRDAVGIELNPEYARIADLRLARWWEDVAVVERPPAVTGQMELA